MIEIIYNDSENNGSSVIVKPPKNIRQIGTPKGRHKIYVEDYVYTFLHSSVFGKEGQRRAAVLLGKSEVSKELRYTFISGAISCDEFIFQEDGILFGENCWEYIYKEIKQYFDSLEIVGWFLELTGFPLELTNVMEAAHRKYFAGRDKLLFLSEPSEGEDVFFVYEQGSLQKKEGYYIYYEKNISMQEYMVCTREKMWEKDRDLFAFETEDMGKESSEQQSETSGQQSESSSQRQSETSGQQSELSGHRQSESSSQRRVESVGEPAEMSAAEQALQNYRAVFQQKKEVPTQRKMNMLLYTAAAAAMVILCVIGVTTINNYEKMKQVEQVLSVIAGAGQQKDGKEEAGEDDKEGHKIPVESVPGEVKEEQPDAQQSETPQPDAQQSETPQPDAQQPDAQQPDTQQPDTQNTGQTTADSGTSDTAAGTDTSQETATAAQIYLDQGYYIVQPGDKLELICKKIYRTTAMMDKLREVNDIEDADKIYAGQKLILP